MIQRTARSLLPASARPAAARPAAAGALAALIILSGCTQADGGDAAAGTTAPAAPEATGTSGTEGAGEDETAYGELIDGFPAVIEPLPDGEIVSSTLSPRDGRSGGEDTGSEAATDSAGGDGSAAADGEVGVSLVQTSSQPVEEVMGFYTESLRGHGFEPVGEATTEGDATTQTFHKPDTAETLSLSVHTDADEAGKRQLTIGGVVAR